MNNRVLVILLSAFLVAAGCSYVVYRAIGNRLSSATPQTSGVVVAATDIKLGHVLRDTDLKMVQMSGGLPKGAITSRQDAIGRGVISNIYQGEPVLTNRLAAPGAGGGLAATIPPGMRACAVKVDDVVGVAGFVTSGMRVDVLISGNPPGPSVVGEGTRVKTLLQNIQVLSAGTDMQQDSGVDARPKQVQVVNLLVTPEQAEELSLASNQTHIQLVLRNPLDTETSEPPGTALGALFGGSKAPVVAPVAPRPQTAAVHVAAKPEPAHTYSVQVFNGTKQTEAKFPSAEGKE